MIEINNSPIDFHFPFSSFRQNQREILHQVQKSLDAGTEVIIIEGPTGFGKSPVNIALAKYLQPSFYTTPQVSLVKQTASDFGPKKFAIDGGYGDVMALLGRQNYICKATNQLSHVCAIRDNYESSCADEPMCTYQAQKLSTINSKVAVLTFAMLILNAFGQRFRNRNLLIVDECHNLENQVASMFANVTISPYIFPAKLQNKYWYNLRDQLPKSKNIEDYKSCFEYLKEIINKARFDDIKTNSDNDKINDFARKLDYMTNEIKYGRTWVINHTKTKFNDSWEKKIIFKPISVDLFLKRTIWSQAKQIILSTATVPFRNNIQNWLYRLGLGDKSYKLYSAPMTFPLSNRPIFFYENGGKMTKNLEDVNWEKNLQIINKIIKKHSSEKGVIHTQSYKRAKRLAESLNSPADVFLHDKTKVDGDIIKAWINSKKRILLSPAIKEGVDLKGDICRFQILMKIPYPNFHDSRVKYLLEVKKAWNWYFNEASRDITQMYGRAIRSHDDYATFYIIDSSFKDVYNRGSFPDWFKNALTIEVIS